MSHSNDASVTDPRLRASGPVAKRFGALLALPLAFACSISEEAPTDGSPSGGATTGSAGAQPSASAIA